MARFGYSAHALFEMAKRAIERSDVDAALAAPSQKVHEHDDIMCYQSKFYSAGKWYLLRVMVTEIKEPFLVVTVYKTSKFGKYWRDE